MATDEFKEVQRVLRQLPAVLQHKVVTSAARASARVIAKEAKARVPVRSGLLQRSIGVAKAKKRDTPKDMVRFYVVPKTKVSISKKVLIGGKNAKLKAKMQSYHGHFVEFGTKNMNAQPYLLPAAEATRAQVVETFQQKIHEGVEKQVKRLAR